MRRSALIALAALGLLSPAWAQEDEGVTEGQLAPEIAATEWLNAGEKPPTLESLRGKVVVLYFWGIW